MVVLYLQLTDEGTEVLSFSNLAKISYLVIVTTIIKANVYMGLTLCQHHSNCFHTLTNIILLTKL